MRYSTTAIVLAAMSIGEAVAGPTHAHLHRKAHEKKDTVDWAALDWDDMGINWSSAYEAGQAAKTAAVAAPVATTAEAVATTTAAAAAAPAATTASSDVTTSAKSSAGSLFEGLVGAANSITSFGDSCGCSSGTAGDFYMGEVGSPYGHNMMKVASTVGYDFTNTFTNTQSVPITVNIWNKVGHDMQPLSGSALAPENTSLTFTLPAGSSQVVAFLANSQVGWAEPVAARAASGAFPTAWGEANFAAGGSGYDLSAIMNPSGNNYNMKISSVEAPACDSDPTQNYWLTATEPIGGSDGSCYIAQSTAHLTTVMGGTI